MVWFGGFVGCFVLLGEGIRLGLRIGMGVMGGGSPTSTVMLWR